MSPYNLLYPTVSRGELCHADISALVTNPLFLLVVAGIGALFGYAFKVFRDVWRAKIKHREELATHVVKQIEKYTRRSISWSITLITSLIF